MTHIYDDLLSETRSKDIFNKIEDIIFRKIPELERKEFIEHFVAEDSTAMQIAHDLCDYLGIERRFNRSAIAEFLKNLEGGK